MTSEQVSCVDEMAAKQEVKGFLCEDAPVCGHHRIFGGKVLRHAGAGVVQRVVVSTENGFGLAGVFADVLDRGVAIKDGLQVDVGPPSQQDPLE